MTEQTTEFTPWLKRAARERVVLAHLQEHGPCTCAALTARCGVSEGATIVTLRIMRKRKLIDFVRFGPKALWALPEQVADVEAAFLETHAINLARRTQQRREQRKRRREAAVTKVVEDWCARVNWKIVPAAQAEPLAPLLPPAHTRLDMILAGAV